MPRGRGDERRLREIVDRVAADVDVARTRKAQQRRPRRKILVVRHPALDDEARSDLGEVGALARASGMLCCRLRSGERSRLAHGLVQVDTLQGAVAHRHGRAAGEGFLHRPDGRTRGLHVQRDIAPALDQTIVERVFEERTDRHALEPAF